MILNDNYIKDQIEELKGQSEKLYAKIYTDNDGISRSLMQMQASLDHSRGKLENIDNTLTSHEVRLDNVEILVRDATNRLAKSDHYKNIIFTALVSFLVPTVIAAFMTGHIKHFTIDQADNEKQNRSN
jgi:type II restriction/modification system DNA methylase subunit YeeA